MNMPRTLAKAYRRLRKIH